ncbi:hypothetical protein FRB95_010801 [Tulasnella sp. JGI-2019a]|nr:hypothetical protein FRB95_010801 [Tulasnella sp. JGI-2019a]
MGDVHVGSVTPVGKGIECEEMRFGGRQATTGSATITISKHEVMSSFGLLEICVERPTSLDPDSVRSMYGDGRLMSRLGSIAHPGIDCTRFSRFFN